MKILRLLLLVASLTFVAESVSAAELKAGAALIDITPIQFPVLVNGGMNSRTVDKVVAPLYARAIVLDDGKERIAIVVVDSCMIGRVVLDDAKHMAAQKTKIRPDRMLISATHTHTAPSSMGCLGTDMDETYVPLLRSRLVDVIAQAESRLEPAEVGWGLANAADYTALRRWIIRPDRVATDPFGNPTVRANMHAGANYDNVTGESGPEDPDLSMISFRSKTGRPIAVLANFSMHYFSGVEALHPDYFGLFCNGFQERVGRSAPVAGACGPVAGACAPVAGVCEGTGESESAEDQHPFVAIMSHGCSGDIWRRDYTKPAPEPAPTVTDYTSGLLEIAFGAYDAIQYSGDADLAMAEHRLPLKYRVPNLQTLEWARRIVAETGDRLPKSTEEVYAREQVILHELQSTEVVVQALRMGDLAIATTPNETYALTGLKLKLQSPLKHTMVIELANGGDGYIPPAEQHPLGGYNTWAARSAGLEVTAEPKITATALRLLEQVTGKPRREHRQSVGSAAAAIKAAKPVAWWRMDELSAPHAADSSGHHRDAIYEPGVVFFLEGPHSSAFCTDNETNRAAHFAGGRLSTVLHELGQTYSVSIWLWNGMPGDGRGTSGWLMSRDHDHGLSLTGDHLGIGGTDSAPGRLIFRHGDLAADVAAGTTIIPRWTWTHVALIRDGTNVRVHLNGAAQPEIQVVAAPANPTQSSQFFFGGRSDNADNWEGRLDEIAVFDRVLTSAEISKLAVRNP